MARKILLADDSVTAQNMGRKILADAGYEIITVNNGSAALKKIAELKPDLIILDVYMPGYSGLEVCQRLKEANETSRVPVLLTVGKLEPFKPEEARRARADAFIVKPFEASELLSALTKLEEKIVPRAESSKPGRFARTIAAVEEGRYDKTMGADEDSGWKDRISFPSSKKKKETAAEDVDESAIYNPVNKDLRTVIERKISGPAPEANETKNQSKAEEARVDLGALAPQGLPKDVTPEEIAALASAAAQITGTTVASGMESAAAEKEKPSGQSPAEPALQPAVAARVEAQTEAPAETEEKEPAPQPPVAGVVAASKPEVKDEPIAEEPSITAAQESGPASLGSVPPSPADVAAAVAALEPAAQSAATASSENHFDSREAGVEGSRNDRARVEEEPVTMAVATGASHGAAASHWAAVSVALLPEESSVSLEHEMQKAYAAFAAAEMAHVPAVTAVAEPPASNSSPVQAPVAESSILAQPAALPEVAPAFIAAPIETNDAINAAVKELEATAAALAETIPSATPMPQSPSVQIADSVVQPAHETSPGIEAKGAEAKPFEIAQVEAKQVETRTFEAKEESTAPQTFSAEPAAAESTSQEAASESAQSPQPQPEIESLAPQTSELKAHEDQKKNAQTRDAYTQDERAYGERKYDEPANKDQFQAEHRPIEAAEASVPTAPIASAPAEISESVAKPPTDATSPLSEKPAEPVSADQPADQSTSRATETLAASESAPGPAQESAHDAAARAESAHKEPDIAATTAAAWASWRRVRESGDTRGAGSAKPPLATPLTSKKKDLKRTLPRLRIWPRWPQPPAPRDLPTKFPPTLLPIRPRSPTSSTAFWPTFAPRSSPKSPRK